MGELLTFYQRSRIFFFFFIIPVNGGATIGNFPEALSS